MTAPDAFDAQKLVDESLVQVMHGDKPAFMISGELAQEVDSALAAFAEDDPELKAPGSAQSIWLEGAQQCDFIIGGFKKLYDEAKKRGEVEKARRYFSIAAVFGDRMLAFYGKPTIDHEGLSTIIRRQDAAMLDRRGRGLLGQ